MKTKTYTVGLDLGDRRHPVCVLDKAGEIIAEEGLVNTAEVLRTFSARYPKATIVRETGTHSPWVSRLILALGHPVIVAHARTLRAPETSRSGTYLHGSCSGPSRRLLRRFPAVR